MSKTTDMVIDQMNSEVDSDFLYEKERDDRDIERYEAEQRRK